MNISVDVVLATVFENELKVLLIKRQDAPYKDTLALPGVKVGDKETLEEAVRRTLREEALIEDVIPIEQLYSYGDDLERDPRNRVVTVAYMALLNYEPGYGAGLRVTQAAFYNYEDILNSTQELAFDHRQIIADARERLRGKVWYSDIAYNIAGEEFTLPALQRIFEIILGKELIKANFRRKIKEDVEETGRMTSGDGHKPSMYYRHKK